MSHGIVAGGKTQSDGVDNIYLHATNGGDEGNITRISSAASTATNRSMWSDTRPPATAIGDDKKVKQNESSSLTNSDDDEARSSGRRASTSPPQPVSNVDQHPIQQQAIHPSPSGGVAPLSFWERVASCCCCGGKRGQRRGDSTSSSSSMASTDDEKDATSPGDAPTNDKSHANNKSLEDSFLGDDVKRKVEKKKASSSSKSKKSKSAKEQKEKRSRKGDSGYDIMTVGDSFKVTITDVIYDYRTFDLNSADLEAKLKRKAFCEKHKVELLEFAKLRSDAESAVASTVSPRGKRGDGRVGDSKPNTSVIKPAPIFTTRSTPQTYSNFAQEDVCYIVPRPLAEKIPPPTSPSSSKSPHQTSNSNPTPPTNSSESSIRLDEIAKKYTYLSSYYSSKEEHDIFSCSNQLWLECKRGKSFPRAWRCYTPKPARVVDLKMMDKDHSVLSKICLHRGPVQELGTVAVVNAANERCLGGGGVDSAVHAGAGPLLLRECCSFNGCAVGHTRLTKGYNLPAKFVLHTVGPQGENRSALRSCYITCLDLCRLNGINSIAFCAISTGIYGYPLEKATKVAIATVAEYLSLFPMDFTAVVFACFREEEYEVYKRCMRVTVADALQSLNESGRRSDLERLRQSLIAPPGSSKSKNVVASKSKERKSSGKKASLSKVRPNDEHGGGLPFASNGVSSAGSPNHSSAGDRDHDDDAESDGRENRSDPMSKSKSDSKSRSQKRKEGRKSPSSPQPSSTKEKTQSGAKHQSTTADGEQSRPRSKSAAEAFVELFSPKSAPTRRNAASSVTSHFRDGSDTGVAMTAGKRRLSRSGGKPTLEVPEVDQETSFGSPSSREAPPTAQHQTHANEEKALLEKLWREAMQAETEGIPLQEEADGGENDDEFWQPVVGDDGAYGYEDGAGDGITLTRDVSLEIVPICGTKAAYNGIVRRSDDDDDSDKEELSASLSS